MNFSQLLYGLHVGFLHQIKPNFRAIAIGYVDGGLKIKVYCDADPQDDDDEILKAIISEAEVHIDGVKYVSTEIIYSEDPVKLLDSLDFWYFLRYDIE